MDAQAALCFCRFSHEVAQIIHVQRVKTDQYCYVNTLSENSDHYCYVNTFSSYSLIVN